MDRRRSLQAARCADTTLTALELWLRGYAISPAIRERIERTLRRRKARA